MIIRTLTILCLLACTAMAQTTRPATQPATRPSGFALYDSTQYADRESMGLPTLYLAYLGRRTEILDNGTRGNVGEPRHPDAWFAMGLASRLAGSPLCVLNVEGDGWSIHHPEPPERRAVAYARIIEAAQAVRRAGSKVGVYYAGTTHGFNPETSADTMQRAYVMDRELQQLRPHVDYVLVGAYIHSDDFGTWRRDYYRSLRMASALDKPIIVFLAPHYASFAAPAQRWQLLPGKLWRQVLDEVYTSAQIPGSAVVGATIWGGMDLTRSPYPPLPFDPQAEWWQATRAFLAEREGRN